VSICMALASLAALKALDEEGMAGSVEAGSTQRHNSLSSAATILAVTNSMRFYSQSNARWAFDSMVITPVGPGILSLR
jgi:hypothetical protein